MLNGNAQKTRTFMKGGFNMTKENRKKYGLALTAFGIGAALGFVNCLSKVADAHKDKFPDGKVTVNLTKNSTLSIKNLKTKKES